MTAIETRIQEMLAAISDSKGFSIVDAEGFVAQMRRTVGDPEFTNLDAWVIQTNLEDVMNLPDYYQLRNESVATENAGCPVAPRRN